MQWKNQMENLNAATHNPVGSVLSELTDTEMDTVAGGVQALGFTDGNCLYSITADCTPWLLGCGKL
ncbi:hypothetical protein [Bacillus toyonensis]|uniref:hypothetical protein n=1 Tax=Bacillus toyonensis TaxID=155322 RepID=UPI000BEC11BE|nr:hypothetical protein [Bacillus toyonensis]PDZ30877.1 hypothetical protein CON68_28275 [Bacillus toyonensis]PEI46930.1 hypothetical protein CN631_23110 [Bacillus toyonensis]PEJ10967.1 hypothetical protein CN682_26880 [Bacillus toyonensis]PEJ84758.1 hypothetical protein CN891_22500 [Bacillus toyonensis]PFX64870.1 hypothetical protein COL35_24660 [Bacillus toyonensis]